MVLVAVYGAGKFSVQVCDCHHKQKHVPDTSRRPKKKRMLLIFKPFIAVIYKFEKYI